MLSDASSSTVGAPPAIRRRLPGLKRTRNSAPSATVRRAASPKPSTLPPHIHDRGDQRHDERREDYADHFVETFSCSWNTEPKITDRRATKEASALGHNRPIGCGAVEEHQVERSTDGLELRP